MYRLDVLGTTSTTAYTVWFSPDISIVQWNTRINGAGTLTFHMLASNPKATDAALLHFRRVRLSRKRSDAAGYAPIWTGYIEEVTQYGDVIEVVCSGMLKFFRKRWAATNQNFTLGGTVEAFSLLTGTNSTDGETGVSTGSGSVVTTRSLTMSGDADILKAWELLAQAHDAEFEIDEDFEFNFVDSLGSDKSGTIILTQRRDGRTGSNVQSIRRGASATDMANKLILVSSAGGGITSTYTSANTSTYGVIIDKRAFNEANNQTALDAIKDALGPQLEYPLTDFDIVPEMESLKFGVTSGQRVLSGLSIDDIELGDLLTLNVITENENISEVKRVVEIRMEVSEEGSEKLSLTLSKAGVFISAAYLDSNRIGDLTRRIKQVESQLS